MSWSVRIHDRAERELLRLPNHVVRRVVARIAGLEENPFPSGHKKLAGSNAYRIRVGDYRVLYEVNSAENSVMVYAIGHRRDVYRRK